MIDVAARAGVSPSTVSRALNHPGRLNSQTASQIRSLAQSMGYPLPDHPPSRDATGPVLITFLVQDASNGISSQILAGAQEALPEQGAVGIIEAGSELRRTEDLLERLVGHTRGIILATDQVRTPTARRLGRRLPLVVLNRPMEGLPSVLPDASTGLAQALELLRRQGRRSVVYIASRVGAWSDRSRWESAQALSRAMGLECRRMGPVDPTVQGGRQAAAALGQEPPDAVVAYNDLIAAGVILGLQSEGITVPDRVGVIGFDNTMVAPVVKPAVATIRIPRRAIGHAAADILLGHKPEIRQSRQQSSLTARLRKAGIPPVTEDPGALAVPTSLILRDSLGILDFERTRRGIAEPAGMTRPR